MCPAGPKGGGNYFARLLKKHLSNEEIHVSYSEGNFNAWDEFQGGRGRSKNEDSNQFKMKILTIAADTDKGKFMVSV